MLRQADIMGPSPFTGETGDAWAINHPSDHEPWNPTTNLKFVYGNGQFHVSDKEDYEILARNSGVGPDYKGPLAIGTIHLDHSKAQFEVSTNLHAKGIERVLQIVCQKQGWQYGGVTDMAGQMLSGSKVSSIYFQAEGDMLKFAHSKTSLSHIDGAMHINGDRIYVYPLLKAYFPVLQEFAENTGKSIYAGNDNVIKRIEDIEEGNVYSPEWNNPEDHFLRRDPDDYDQQMSGPFECGTCHQEFPSMNALVEHRKNDEDEWDSVQTAPPEVTWANPDDFPNMDATIPNRFLEEQKFYGAALLPAPVPFIYDIKEDKIDVGMPGQTKDTHGANYTPGQMVRGTYNPGGKLEIESLSNVSITVQHLMELWTWSQPQMPIKSVWIDVGGKTPERVASWSPQVS